MEWSELERRGEERREKAKDSWREDVQEERVGRERKKKKKKAESKTARRLKEEENFEKNKNNARREIGGREKERGPRKMKK